MILKIIHNGRYTLAFFSNHHSPFFRLCLAVIKQLLGSNNEQTRSHKAKLDNPYLAQPYPCSTASVERAFGVCL
jgi:hypothetical protein